MSELANRIRAKSGEIRANAILIKLTMGAINQVASGGDLLAAGPLSTFVERLFEADRALKSDLVNLKREYLEEEGDEWVEEPRHARFR